MTERVYTFFDSAPSSRASAVRNAARSVIENLEGRTLSAELKEVGRLSPERAISIFRQVCRALREAHLLGVVHRDMKPGNIFLVKKKNDEENKMKKKKRKKRKDEQKNDDKMIANEEKKNEKNARKEKKSAEKLNVEKKKMRNERRKNDANWTGKRENDEMKREENEND